MFKSAQKSLSEFLAEKPHLADLVQKFNLEKVEICFRNSSFSPDRRAVSVITDYALRCDRFAKNLDALIAQAKSQGANQAQNIDLDAYVIDFKKDYNERLFSLFNDYLGSESRCANWAVTGPARFPVERNRRRMESAQNKYDAINAAEEKALKKAKRDLFPNGDGSFINSASDNAVEQLEQKIAETKAAHEKMKQINAIARKYYPQGSTEQATSKTKQRCIDELKEQCNLTQEEAEKLLKPCQYRAVVIPFETYQLQRSLQEIARLESRLAEIARLQSQKSELEGQFKNGERFFVIDNRIAIDFGYKPSDEIRHLLSKNAFKFSPSRGNLWVRKLTANAKFAFEATVKPGIEAMLEQN
ncbi:hypothetical protein BC355_08815 [Vibrio cholerae]|uniref:Uncharacterized protein n=1 Tax=Vibrio cholerae TaxID=666 RepID=A0A395TZS5_VIBCL|nr:hypothetical protein [Vibrio cholerae]RGP89812.1 hypothetical protein BC353_09625 [Vibrio cholerae]RGP89996.1 hypothetical protein BC355_08815 [Vibrio cholerae]RGP90719.1 hypothetical protein BC354_08010 [Vibrio cholerae]